MLKMLKQLVTGGVQVVNQRRRPKLKKWRPAHTATRHGAKVRFRFPRYNRAHRHGWAGHFRNMRRAKVGRVKSLFRRLLRRDKRASEVKA